MNITMEHVSKSYGTGTPVIHDLSLELKAGEMFFLLGPSGCGKTTILRMLAGFIQPDAGTILFGDKRVNEQSPQDRQTALVFQNYALWPHLNVFDNVAYAPRAQKQPTATVHERVHSALATVRMQDYAERKPQELSGGQQQRVALARALAAQPKLLLLDEPLSNLDATLRLELRRELKRIHTETGLTTLFVTHDQQEALALAQRIAVMQQGRIVQVGTPREIYENPATAFVARFIGEMNLYPAHSPLAQALGLLTTQTWGFRPERVELAPSGLPARVRQVTYLGEKVELLAEAGTGELIKIVTREMPALAETIHVSVPKNGLLTFPD